MVEIKYRIEIKETYPVRHKEVVESTTQHLGQLTEDFCRALERIFGTDLARYMLKDQVLPVIQKKVGQ